MISIKAYGGMLLRFHYPDGVDLHFYLANLGCPEFLLLLAGMNRIHGTPVLLPPNPRPDPDSPANAKRVYGFPAAA